MTFVERGLINFTTAFTTAIVRKIKKELTGDRFLYREAVLSREIIKGIHVEDRIGPVDTAIDKLSLVTRTDSGSGVVWIGPGPTDVFVTNQIVRIGCPGGRGH